VEADALSITIYEKPLSSVPSVAQATIFELKAPETFSDWRDATQYLMYNVFEFREGLLRKPSYAFGLEKHDSLLDMLPDRHSTRRIVIVSTTKSHTARHQPLKAIMTLEEAHVCLENGLKYAFYDKLQSACIDGPRNSTAQVSKNCSVSLPIRAQALAKYLSRPSSAPDGLPSNEVIADQANCPNQLSLDEFKSLATISLGSEIMWQNILVQLAMPGVDFARTETQCMLQQIVHQAGPPNGEVERKLHCILHDQEFCHSVLVKLETFLQSLSENWESWKALATFSLLARRILSLSSSDTVTKRSLEYLVEVRHVSLRWLRKLEDRVMASTNREQRFGLHYRTLDIALLCASTFDIDDINLSKVFGNLAAVSALIQCSVTISENQHCLRSAPEGLSKIMHQSWRRLMYRILPTVQEQICYSDQGLNQAILASWAAFQPVPEVGWTKLSESQCQWLYTVSGRFTIHFDLLKGELLVNGKPLTRLPAHLTQHATYVQLFGTAILEVGPSDVDGMDFSAKSTRQDYKLNFGMRGKDMLLTASKDGSM
jgi:hypothetical protein